MSEHAWRIFAYHLPADMHDVNIMHVVVRDRFSRDAGDLLCGDLVQQLRRLDDAASPLSRKGEPRAFGLHR